jgi:hypothetical protein
MARRAGPGAYADWRHPYADRRSVHRQTGAACIGRPAQCIDRPARRPYAERRHPYPDRGAGLLIQKFGHFADCLRIGTTIANRQCIRAQTCRISII